MLSVAGVQGKEVKTKTKIYGLQGDLHPRRSGDIVAVLLPDGRGTIARLSSPDGGLMLQPGRLLGQQSKIVALFEHNADFCLRLVERDGTGHLGHVQITCEAVAVFERGPHVKLIWRAFAAHLEPGLVQHLETLFLDSGVTAAPYKDLLVYPEGQSKPTRINIGGVDFWRDQVEVLPWKAFSVNGRPCLALGHEAGQPVDQYLLKFGGDHVLPARVEFM